MSRWTEEQDAVLRDGYEKAKLAVEIAAELGMNKNRVLGRAFRLGLSSKLQGIAGNQRYRELYGASGARSSDQENFYEQVKVWAETHPFGTLKECADSLGISKNTTIKHAKRIRASWSTQRSTIA